MSAQFKKRQLKDGAYLTLCMLRKAVSLLKVDIHDANR